MFSSPMVSFAPRALVAALDHEEKTRHEPDVVTSLPPAPAHKRTPVLPLTPTLRGCRGPERRLTRSAGSSPAGACPC